MGVDADIFRRQPIRIYYATEFNDISVQKEGARHDPESIERMEASTVRVCWTFCLLQVDKYTYMLTCVHVCRSRCSVK